MTSTIKIFGLIAAVVAVYWFYLKDRDASKSSFDLVPAPPLPAPPTADAPGTETTAEPSPILPLTNPQVVAAIRTQTAAIYGNELEREVVYDAKSVRDGIFTGLLYRNGIRRALNSALPSGNANRIPVIPPTVDREYQDRLELITELTAMEEMDGRREWSEVQQTWRQAADMGAVAGFSFWPPDMVQLIDEGVFFVSGPADRNKSERYDSWSKDVKTLAANLMTANRKAEDAIRNKAIQQLRGRGWRLEGYDFDN